MSDPRRMSNPRRMSGPRRPMSGPGQPGPTAGAGGRGARAMERGAGAGWRRAAALVLAAVAMPALGLATAVPAAASGGRPAPSLPAPIDKAVPVSVAPGIAILDLDSRRGFLGAGDAEPLAPVMSADGDHAIWQYNSYHGLYGLAWRDLSTGRTILQQGLWPYGSDISANGAYVVYATAAVLAPSGLIRGMDVWLWDTRTGQRTLINRTPSGKVAVDGLVRGLHISADGNYVVFASTSQSMAPAGLKMCVSSCNNAPGYLYLYDLATAKLRALPKQAAFGDAPALGYPVISGNGAIVAFHSGLNVDVWSTVTNQVWPVAFQKNVGQTASNSLAVSANGEVLANRGPGGIGVLQLGTPAGKYRQEWAYYDKGGAANFPSVALSGDGNVLAFFGPRGGPTGATGPCGGWRSLRE